MRVKHRLAAALSEIMDAEISANDIDIPDGGHGDFAFPAMKVAENPQTAAEAAAGELEELEIVEEAAVAGPGFINVYLDRQLFASATGSMLETDTMGVTQRSGDLLLEFSSPNVAKPMHIGHFRNNALGDALQRILRFVGYDVTSENYIGDWGTQYGKLIYAFKEFGSNEEFEEEPMEHMFDLYVKFHDEMEDNEELEEEGRRWAAKIEEGDEEAVELWEMFRDASIDHHRKDYRRMGVHFDLWTGESTVVEETRQVIEEGKEKEVFKQDEDGSLYTEFDELPDVVVQKADGTTLYLSRDIANLKIRNEKGFEHNLILTASEQDLHFQQVEAAAEQMGYDTEGYEHISYGLLKLPEGGMSSREGRVVRLSELLDEAEQRAEAKLEEKDKDLDVAEEVGIGAAKYANLKVSRSKDIEFDWERALSFQGDSGPYLQYSNTRARSILENASDTGEIVGAVDDEEHRLVMELAQFPGVVEDAADNREPAKLANYLSQLCEEFNSFYHSCPVLEADERTRKRRLKIVELFVAVTETGLELLGIEPLEEM